MGEDVSVLVENGKSRRATLFQGAERESSGNIVTFAQKPPDKSGQIPEVEAFPPEEKTIRTVTGEGLTPSEFEGKYGVSAEGVTSEEEATKRVEGWEKTQQWAAEKALEHEQKKQEQVLATLPKQPSGETGYTQVVPLPEQMPSGGKKESSFKQFIRTILQLFKIKRQA